MCDFILISINNKVKKTFPDKIDHEKGEFKSEYQKYRIVVSMTTSF